MPTNTENPFQLVRFVKAQAGLYESALSELRSGKKRTHWMWFVFPQFAGLGFSSTASFYAIKSPEEAEAYLAHPVLGRRLEESTEVLLALEGLTAADIFGYPDDLKFCSSMTLFEWVTIERALDSDRMQVKNTQVFKDALTKYCGGRRDQKTLALIQANRSS